MRTIAITGSASGMGAATAARVRAAGDRVIGIDVRDADVVADLGTPEGRAAAIVAVTELSGARSTAWSRPPASPACPTAPPRCSSR